MGEAEHSHYVAQLKAEFDSCDSSASGFLDRDQLVALCRKLQLEAELPRLLHLLLGECASSRVNFQDFKDGFVSLLSRSLDVSPSGDNTCPLQPVVPDEVKPKFVKGTKRYGRRSRPDIKSAGTLSQDSEDSPPSTTETTDYLQAGVRRAKLRRSTSLESVESLKSDEETGSQKIAEADFIHKAFQQQEGAEHDSVGGAFVLTNLSDCPHLQQQLNNQDPNPVLRNMDPDLDTQVTIGDLRNLLLCSALPLSCSTPSKAADLKRAPLRDELLSEEHSLRSTSPSLLTATVGQRVLSRLDDGSGCTSPEHVIALWTEEGIRNSRDILQTLDFPLEERLSLADLTLALDNELLVSGNGIHQAALISYKNEIQHLQVLAEQACRQRDKVRADLDAADQRNLKLVREVDDRHANMETLNQSRIRDLELDFRDRLSALRCQSEQEIETLQQQAEGECRALQEELQLLQAQEEELRGDLNTTTQENSRLEDELFVVKLKLADAEKMVNKLQSDLDRVLQDKFEGLDRAGAALSHEERFSEIVKQYELQCRELQDRNDELNSELELLKSQRSDRESRRSAGDTRTTAALTWTEQAVSAESDCDDLDVKRLSPPATKKKLKPVDKTGLSSLDNVSGPVVSIQTEMALEQLKQKHEQELQELRIQLETQVNFYERNLELMRQNMEVERKDISQAFKLEISELEEHKAQAEHQVQQLKDSVEKLQMQMQKGGGVTGGGGWSSEQERRMQRERSEMEQNFAREIGNLVERLRAEKDQLEAELKLKMDQEVMLVRDQSEQQIGQMKRHHAEAQHHLHHQEQQRMQEQRGLWELRLVQSEEKAGEEWVRLLSQFSSEKKDIEARHEEELRLLKEELRGLHDAQQTSALQMSESEANLQECRSRCAQLEDDVCACRGRCSQLEARLEEACTQLEESISFLESQEIQSNRLLAEKNTVDVELQLVRDREEQLIGQVTQLKEELGGVQVLSDSIQQDRELVANKCRDISKAFAQQQAQLQARDQTISALKTELERLQETTRTRSTELDSLKADRARLIQDLKEQAMAVDKLQLQLDEVTEELERRRSNEENLRGTLQEQRNQTRQLQSGLKDQEEELLCLRQENCSYTRLADQLSTQIVEMEEEITSLREQLRGLSEQLNDTADLVVNLRTQLNARTSEGQHLRAETVSEVERLQQALQGAEDQHRRTKDDFEEQKKKMGQQLMELETLVLALEGATHPESSHRTQVEELRTENSALQERVKVLQQDVQNLEDDVVKKKRKVEELEGEHKRGREEEERLHRENSRYREEVLELSSRNLQLSNDNAELSARLRGDEESLRMLQQRLATVSEKNEEGEALVRRLQATSSQQEREKVQQQVAWTQERHLLEDELKVYKQKLGHLTDLEAEVSSATLKLQWMEEDKKKLLRETENHKQELEALQHSVVSLQSEAELFRSRLQAANNEKLGHIHEVTELQRKLEEAHNKAEKLELSVQRLRQEKEGQCRAMAVQEEQASVTLREETQRLSLQNQELHQKLASLQVKQQEAQNLNQEQQNLKTRLSELETERTKANEQAVRADAALSLARAQHTRQLQELQERASSTSGNREREEQLEAWLKEEQRRSQQLEETLRHQTGQISIKQEQYEKVSLSLQQRTEDLELKLKAVQTVLQEKVQQLKEQLAKNAQSNAQLKDVYVENSQLIKALQITEQRQKHAEKKNIHLEEKVGALHRLLRQIVPAALAT